MFDDEAWWHDMDDDKFNEVDYDEFDEAWLLILFGYLMHFV